MTSFVRSAKELFNIENNQHEIEIKYDKYLEGFGFEKFKDHFATSLLGTESIYSVPTNQKSIRYEQFLDTMVHKTTETIRKSVLVQLETIMVENKNIYNL